MSKTKGSKNYFQNGTLYFLKDVIGYIRKFEPALDIPQSWEHGGGLNDLARKFEIVPDYDNGIKGKGHFTKYKYTTMYKFARLVIDYLKNTTPKKPRLTPIEVANKEAKKQEEQAPVIVLDPTPKQVEEFKEKWPERNELVELKPLDPIPKGFVILRDVEGIPFMIPIKSIFFVSPYCEDRELTNIEYMTEDNRRYCPVSCDSFDVVVDLIRKALEV